ncbi:MAG TPA: acetyl-CoA carboxylase biotin carboxyl carrier protein subunit [Rhizomicrobium sp.]|nr:acetyl-CoA carboxylase biotin carboxyl carrier protein subunit [Rhizomicrobium sp.]
MSDEKESAAIDADAIRALADLLTETSLTEIEIERNGVRMRVARQVTQVHSAPAAAAPPAPANDAKREAAIGTIPSPMVGTVYVAPEPGAQPFVKVGDAVSEGDTLLIVEAMKTMNPILAPRDGVVAEICVHDTQPVEFGQALLILN